VEEERDRLGRYRLVRHHYDRLGRPSVRRETVRSAWRHPATYRDQYDAMGRLAREDVVENGVTLQTTHAYDDRNRIETVISWEGASGPIELVTRFAYDAVGRVIVEDSGNGAGTRFRYDPAGNLSVKEEYRGPDVIMRTRYDYACWEHAPRVNDAAIDLLERP